VTPTYVYDPVVLEELARHGLAPRANTPPQRLRDAVLDLYKYEIKSLRGRLLAGRIERRNYADEVIALRKRYRLLSLPVQQWIVEGHPSDPRSSASRSVTNDDSL
jgi:hypothetical protein